MGLQRARGGRGSGGGGGGRHEALTTTAPHTPIAPTNIPGPPWANALRTPASPTSNSGVKMFSSSCSKFSSRPCSLYRLYSRGTCPGRGGAGKDVRTRGGWVSPMASPLWLTPAPHSGGPHQLCPASHPSTPTCIIHTLLLLYSLFCTTQAASVSHSTGLRPYTLMRYSAAQEGGGGR